MDEQELLKERFKSAVSSTVKAISENFDLEIRFGNITDSKKDSLNLPEVINLKKLQDFTNLRAFADSIALKSYYGLSELLTGNVDTSEKAIHKAESWLKEHPLNKEDNYDYDAYLLYWPLYLYYDKLNLSDKANGYLEMAYEIVGKEKIEKYHGHPEKDTHPEFFYCRDIIKEYEASLNQ